LTVSPSSVIFQLGAAKDVEGTTMRDAPLEALIDPAHRPIGVAIIQDAYDLDTPWHHHDMHQLQYAFDGAIEVEDEYARYLLTRSLAAWIPAGVAHRTSLHRVRSGSILFAQEAVALADHRVRIVEVSPLMREMVRGAMRWPLHESLDATGQAYFAALARLCAEWISKETPLLLPTTRDPALRAAIAYTRVNLRGSDIGALCRAAGLSERTLRRRFHHELGMSWDAYRRRARLLAAAALLSDTRLPIGLIANQVGFESQSAFAKSFRGLTGKNPRDFRGSE
jgi:transcriptional regulator GlxA family with amidase domain